MENIAMMTTDLERTHEKCIKSIHTIYLFNIDKH